MAAARGGDGDGGGRRRIGQREGGSHRALLHSTPPLISVEVGEQGGGGGWSTAMELAGNRSERRKEPIPAPSFCSACARGSQRRVAAARGDQRRSPFICVRGDCWRRPGEPGRQPGGNPLLWLCGGDEKQAVGLDPSGGGHGGAAAARGRCSGRPATMLLPSRTSIPARRVRSPVCKSCTAHAKLVQIRHREVKNLAQHNNPIQCTDLHLTEIILNDYRGTTEDIKFVRFFVREVSVLKVMRFATCVKFDLEWFADQRRRLKLNGKASAEANFMIINWYDRLFGGRSIKPIDDILVADSFAEIVHPFDTEDDEINF